MADVTTSARELTHRRPGLGFGKWFRSLIFIVVWMSTLFLAAGTVHWTRGWVFAIVYSGSVAAVSLAASHWNPDLMKERLAWGHKDTKPFDKVFIAIHFSLTGVIPAIAGLDAVRFRWTSMPAWTVVPGVVLLLLAMALIAWTLKSNPWAEETVRIQADRDQRVVRTGPYRIVRHPMYVGALVMYPAMAGILGSMLALAIAALEMVAFLWRTAREDRTLRSELPGYEEYARVTKYRLVPGIW